MGGAPQENRHCPPSIFLIIFLMKLILLVWVLIPGSLAFSQEAGQQNGVLSIEQLEQIRADHARTFGAVATLEDHLLRDTALAAQRNYDGQGTAFYLGFQSLLEAARAMDTSSTVQPYDVHAFRVGMGTRFRRFGLYYAAAANMGYLREGEDWEPWLPMMVNYMIGHAYAVAAPFIGGLESDVGYASVLRLDYVAGVSVDAGIAEFGAGYVGSSGVYVTVYQNRINAYLRGLLQLDAQPEDLLPFVAAGITGLTPLSRYLSTSFTDLGVQRSTWRLPSGATLADRWFGDFRQKDIFGIIDIGLSYAWEPVPQFREISAGLHTRGYHQEVESYESRRAAFGVTAGVVSLPDLPEFNITGGQRFSFSADLLLYPNFPERGYTRIALRRNHPDTLELFPYARDGWDFNLEMIVRL